MGFQGKNWIFSRAHFFERVWLYTIASGPKGWLKIAKKTLCHKDDLLRGKELWFFIDGKIGWCFVSFWKEEKIISRMVELWQTKKGLICEPTFWHDFGTFFHWSKNSIGRQHFLMELRKSFLTSLPHLQEIHCFCAAVEKPLKILQKLSFRLTMSNQHFSSLGVKFKVLESFF